MKIGDKVVLIGRDLLPKWQGLTAVIVLIHEASGLTVEVNGTRLMVFQNEVRAL